MKHAAFCVIKPQQCFMPEQVRYNAARFRCAQKATLNYKKFFTEDGKGDTIMRIQTTHAIRICAAGLYR